MTHHIKSLIAIAGGNCNIFSGNNKVEITPLFSNFVPSCFKLTNKLGLIKLNFQETLKLKRESLYQRIYYGKLVIPHMKNGKKYLFKTEDVAEYIQSEFERSTSILTIKLVN